MEGSRPFLVGASVVLRPLVESDVEGDYPNWFNDAEVCAGNSHHVFPYTREEALAYIRGLAGATDKLVLAIAHKVDGRHVGNVALADLQPLHRRAEFSIVIGDRSAWGKGVATEAGRLLLAHGFDAMNLHRIQCGTLDDNEAMCGLARRLGMKEEGRRRQAMWKRGRYRDVVLFGVLREEFLAASS